MHEINNDTTIRTDEDYHSSTKSSEDEWSEDDDEIPAGVTDAMMTAPDFVNDEER